MRKLVAVVLPEILTFAVLFSTFGSSVAVAQQPPAKRQSQDFFALVKSIYDRLDTTNKGYFTKEDVDRALTNHTIKGREAHALYVLRQSFSEFAKTPPAGKVSNVSEKVPRVTLLDLEEFDRTLKPAALADAVDAQMEAARAFLAKVNRKLYPSGSAAESLKKMRAVGQVGRGNCYLVSGIGSLSAIAPEEVRKMIQDNGVDKRGVRTFTVSFAGAPKERYIVDEFTDAALLINEVQADSGIWVAVLVRAYGEYLKAHPSTRLVQRLYFRLDARELAEDLTDEGSLNSDGLKMMIDPAQFKLEQHLWGFDDDHLRKYLGPMTDFAQRFLIGPMLEARDESVVHDRLKQAICDNKIPATVYKNGGAHEASIIEYRPGKKSSDGKHSSQYGFVTIRDQAGLSADEQKNVNNGTWWREAGMDDNCFCITVEDFAKTFSGFCCARKR